MKKAFLELYGIRAIQLTILLLTATTVCEAQPINKRYSSYIGDNGIIHFFRPKELKKKVNLDKFVFDMTYMTHKDSITINCSLDVRNDHLIQQLNLKNTQQSIMGEHIAMLFRDVTKNGYRLRITSKFLLSDIQQLFANPSPLSFEATLIDGTHCTATYTSSQWKQESINITRIINSINY